MTQAFNLSQLANNVNTTGQLNAAAGLYNQLPVANGGTGAATLAANAVLLGNGTSALQTVAVGASGNVLTSNGTTWVSQTASGGTPIVTLYTSPSPWTKSPTLKFVKVTVVAGGGGGGGRPGNSSSISGGGSGAVAFAYFPAPSIPGPVTVTVGSGGAGGTAGGPGTSNIGVSGGPSSFGALVSCTGGGAGAGGPAYPGVGGVGGTMTPSPQIYGMPGFDGGSNGSTTASTNLVRTPSPTYSINAFGAPTGFGFGVGGAQLQLTPTTYGSYAPAIGYGSGGGGILGGAPGTGTPGGSGIGGIVIVEEFY